MTNGRKSGLSLQEHQVAGNGLLDRRLFLKKGLQFGAISTIASSTALAATNSETKINPADPPWMHVPGNPFSTYGMPPLLKIMLFASLHKMKAVPVMVFHGRRYI